MNGKFHYRVSRGNNAFLHVHVKRPENNTQNCNIIFAHGFLGSGVENHRMFIRISDQLNKIGFTCVLFDQSGCGYSDGEYESISLNDLREDLKIISIWVSKNLPGKIAYLGQSLGSALILSVDINVPVEFRIAINPAAYFGKWLTKHYGWDLKSKDNCFYAIPKGILVSRALVMGLINWDWLSDLSESDIPSLIIASTCDEIGSVEVAQTIVQKLGNKTNLTLIEKANHSFIGQRELEMELISNIINWLELRGDNA